MTILGLDMNATCARAVHGPAEDYALVMPLDPPNPVLPMVVSLEKSAPEVGGAGLRLLRTDSHLTCHNFLAHLGTHAAAAKRWHGGLHHLDSSQALTVVWQRLGLACAVATRWRWRCRLTFPVPRPT